MTARKPLSSSRIAAVLLLSTLIACSRDHGDGRQPPVPEVAVITATPQTVVLENVLSGRLEASRTAEIRARVPGVLRKRLFVEGSQVKAGQDLFLIDDAPYRAALMSAQANFTKAKADMGRMRPLMDTGAISKQEWDAIVQTYQVSAANLETAKINIGYAHVKAPISGHIGRAEVSEGALVGQGTPTLLATIRQNDPLYVNMSQSAAAVMKMRAAINAGKVRDIEEVPVTIAFEGDSVYAQQGRLLFTDPSVDETTGQVSLRAEVPNPDGVLFPGLFVKVRLTQNEILNAVPVPQQAVTRGTGGDTVTVVNADGTFAPRTVTIGGEKDLHWIVTAGLRAGDQVMVEGATIVQMSRATKVKVRVWTAAKDGQAKTAPAASAAASIAQ